MARLDPIIEKLFKDSGQELLIETGGGVNMRTPAGLQLVLKQNLTTPQILGALAELVPAEKRAGFPPEGTTAFPYAAPAGQVQVTLENVQGRVKVSMVPFSSLPSPAAPEEEKFELASPYEMLEMAAQAADPTAVASEEKFELEPAPGSGAHWLDDAPALVTAPVAAPAVLIPPAPPAPAAPAARPIAVTPAPVPQVAVTEAQGVIHTHPPISPPAPAAPVPVAPAPAVPAPTSPAIRNAPVRPATIPPIPNAAAPAPVPAPTRAPVSAGGPATLPPLPAAAAPAPTAVPAAPAGPATIPPVPTAAAPAAASAGVHPAPHAPAAPAGPATIPPVPTAAAPAVAPAASVIPVAPAAAPATIPPPPAATAPAASVIPVAPAGPATIPPVPVSAPPPVAAAAPVPHSPVPAAAPVTSAAPAAVAGPATHPPVPVAAPPAPAAAPVTQPPTPTPAVAAPARSLTPAPIPAAAPVLALVPEPASPATPSPATSSPATVEVGAQSKDAEGQMLALMEAMLARDASDLHLSSETLPHMRIDGDMVPIEEYGLITPERLKAMLFSIAPEKNRKQWEELNDTDFAYETSAARFRVNVFEDRKGIGAVLRQIPNKIRTAEEIGLSRHVLDMCFLTKGLVLVTGPTGSGKSTTLAALIDYVNRHREDHIITIEDPIEFVHKNKSCLVNQREVGVHTRSFKNALRAALREDPDVVLVGEMRDLETIATAIETAETGHLVFGTLHTNTAASTVDRIIDQFPADRQPQIRMMLSESLKGVIAQSLCKRIGGGRVAAQEVLLCTGSVSNLIREGKTFQIPSVMQTSRGQGMVTLNDSLLDLVKKKVIEPNEALSKSVARAEMRAMLERAGFKADTATGAGGPTETPVPTK